MQFHRTAVFIVLAALGLTSCSFMERLSFNRNLRETSETQTLSLSPSSTLAVVNDVGDIRVVATEGEAQLIVTRRFVRPNDLSFQKRMIANRLEVRAGVRVKNCSGCSTSLEFRIPRGMELSLSTQDGNIIVNGGTRGLEATTDAGAIEARDMGLGRAVLTTNDGNINLRGQSGEAVLKTDAGSITLESAQGFVKATTQDGSITVGNAMNGLEAHTDAGSVTATLVSNTARISTNDGNITVSKLKLQSGTENTMSTDAGSINLSQLEVEGGLTIGGRAATGRVQLDLAEYQLERQNGDDGGSFTATKSGNPMARLRLRTSDGNIAVQSSK
jgi:DUF4097 and DUF4098 domain-containing protein YvlB